MARPFAAQVINLDERRARVGGSEAAAACGVDPHLSRVMLWAQKRGIVKVEETEAMLWGKRLQPVVFDVLEQMGFDLMPAPADGFYDPARPFMIGHPDGFVTRNGERGVVEVKTAGHWSAQDWNDGGTPTSPIVQAQHYMSLTGCGFALLACLLDGQRLVVRWVERDERTIALLEAGEESFVRYVLDGEVPPPDGSASAAQALRALYPEAEPSAVVRLTKAEMVQVRMLRRRREMSDTLGAQISELTQWLQARMGNAERAIDPNDNEVAKWPTFERKSLDTKALRAATPAVASEYTTASTYRRFTLADAPDPKGTENV